MSKTSEELGSGEISYAKLFAFINKFHGTLEKEDGVWAYSHLTPMVTTYRVANKGVGTTPEEAIMSMDAYQNSADKLRAPQRLKEEEAKRLFTMFGELNGKLTFEDPHFPSNGTKPMTAKPYWTVVLFPEGENVVATGPRTNVEAAFKRTLDAYQRRQRCVSLKGI